MSATSDLPADTPSTSAPGQQGQQGQQGQKRARTAGTIAVLVVLVVIILLLLWLLRGCPGEPAAAEPAFEYFDAKAKELGYDEVKVAAFVQNEVRTLPYRGNVKGALATLWEGAGSREERTELLARLLEPCKKRAAADNRTVANVAAPMIEVDEAWPGADGARATLAITHRLHRRDGTVTGTAIVDQPVGDFVGTIHSITVPQAGQTTITLRTYAGEEIAKPVDTTGDDVVSEDVVFTLTLPGATGPERIVRELWHADNRVGPTCPLVGDHHAFVVLPCRVSDFVCEKEELRLKQSKRDESHAGLAYLELLDYCRRSDDHLAKLERQEKVTALFNRPRILVHSTWMLPESAGGPCIALDLRHNLVEFAGADDDAWGGYFSVQTRSFVEAGLEHYWLEERLNRPCISAWAVFNRLVDDYPDTVDRRLAFVQRVADTIMDGTGLSSARFTIADDPVSPVVVVRTSGDGWLVQTPPADTAKVAKLAEATALPEVGLTADGAGIAVGSAAGVALVTELAMMAATRTSEGAHANADYRLVAGIDRASDSLVADGARFEFAWGEGDDRVDQRIRVVKANGTRLEMNWRIHAGVRPAGGTRTVGGEAIATSRVHNPWYRIGATAQTDATSFVVSRRVYAALADGRAADFALQRRFEAGDDPRAARPIEWQGQIEPVGRREHTVTINRQPVTIPVIDCRAGDLQVAILDDPRWPVGMADRLTEVHTTIRARVVDEHGVGISNAVVIIGDDPEAPALPVAIDGSFRIPPRAEANGYATQRAVVKRHEVVLGVTEIDLTAPGLDVITISVPRPVTDVVYIGPDTRARLDPLPLSEQVKRHANAALDAGDWVVIPDSMLPFGVDGVGETIAFFRFNTRTGESIGVTEDGLHGSSAATRQAWAQAARSAADSAIASASDLKEGISPLHVLRGAITAWWVYSIYRLEGDTPEEAVQHMLQDMDAWEQATNIFAQVEAGLGGGQVGGKAREKLAGLMGGGNIDGDAAALAFKIGFLGSAAFLATVED